MGFFDGKTRTAETAVLVGVSVSCGVDATPFKAAPRRNETVVGQTSTTQGRVTRATFYRDHTKNRRPRVVVGRATSGRGWTELGAWSRGLCAVVGQKYPVGL
ncbi:hypothetical protein L6452_00470 [Arctium lappa]|uniref:Uncharacterized protein n=1 Tax=Arctium lappa TaxID=4217 RepID=A0ACB9FE49_ARCLA|nr:hypothetical protein L6452_00470 [Arctium lappa]